MPLAAVVEGEGPPGSRRGMTRPVLLPRRRTRKVGTPCRSQRGMCSSRWSRREREGPARVEEVDDPVSPHAPCVEEVLGQSSRSV